MNSFLSAFRRRILSALAVVCTAAALAGAPAPCRAQGLSEKHPRVNMLIDSGWKFIRQDVTGAQAPDFDDQHWQAVSLPHTWNSRDGQDGGTYYRGPGWYRKHLTLSQKTAGAAYFLKFDGANRVAEVYVNGKKVGMHRGGFAAFCFEVTRQLKPGDNLIAVRVDNAHDPLSPPLSADFTFYGGLYRDAHLLALGDLSISPLDFASPGIYLKQASVTTATARIELTAKLRNGADATRKAQVACRVLDANGKLVAEAVTSQTVASGSSADAAAVLTIDRPHLWNGRQDPYLYQAVVEVSDGKRVTDRVVQPLGLRFFKVDPDKGFFLNGNHVMLRGVCRHQDRKNMGWAITAREHKEDYEMIAEMGANAIRLAHYQHAQPFYDLCDRGGMIVWAEIPMVNEVTPGEGFSDNAVQQMTELVKQNFNHPSICFWSCFNEQGIHLGKPKKDKKTASAAASATGGRKGKKQAVSAAGGDQPDQAAAELAVIRRVNETAKKLDPTRLTASATCIDPEAAINFVTDVLGYNKYFGWYQGTVDGFGPFFDSFHRKHPRTPICVSEYGAGASILQHTDSIEKPKTVSAWHPEEYQAFLHEQTWRQIEQRPYIWGSFLWNMFDFGSDSRKEGDQPGINDKGLVTHDRKVKKDAFYFYKANWSAAPVVYITGRRYNPRPQAVISIKVYSNCPSVELTLNGKSLGKKIAANHVFVWEGIALNPGKNTATATGMQGGRTLVDTVEWDCRPAPPVTR